MSDLHFNKDDYFRVYYTKEDRFWEQRIVDVAGAFGVEMYIREFSLTSSYALSIRICDVDLLTN